MLLNWLFWNQCFKHLPVHWLTQRHRMQNTIISCPESAWGSSFVKATLANITGKTAFAGFFLPKHILWVLIWTLFQAVWQTDKRSLLNIYGSENLIHQLTYYCLTLSLSSCYTKIINLQLKLFSPFSWYYSFHQVFAKMKREIERLRDSKKEVKQNRIFLIRKPYSVKVGSIWKHTYIMMWSTWMPSFLQDAVHHFSCIQFYIYI